MFCFCFQEGFFLGVNVFLFSMTNFLRFVFTSECFVFNLICSTLLTDEGTENIKAVKHRRKWDMFFPSGLTCLTSRSNDR